jgi:hypothetical protein
MFSKTIFLFAGTGGGIGKTTLASNLFDWLRFRCSPSIRVRGFDLDPQGGLSRFYPGLERVGDFKPREVLGSIVADTVHSCFVIDPPGGAQELLEEIFSAYPVAELAFDGVRVVLIVPVTGDRASLRCLLPWMDFASAEIVLVYRKPGPGIGVEIRDSADLGNLPLPLWLEIAGGSSGDGAGETVGEGEGRIKRMLQPRFQPAYLVEHLFNRGISLYQVAYPYSAWARCELSAAEVLVRKQQINTLVGHYWGPGKKYWGVGFYYGYQLTVYMGFLHRQLAMVLGPLLADRAEQAGTAGVTDKVLR